MGLKYICSGSFSQNMCGMGEIANRFIPFSHNRKCFYQIIDKFLTFFEVEYINH